ncbi:MAG: hypothetical protein ACXVZX_12005, partial [Terriglobales bacterium]
IVDAVAGSGGVKGLVARCATGGASLLLQEKEKQDRATSKVTHAKRFIRAFSITDYFNAGKANSGRGRWASIAERAKKEIPRG